MTFPKQNVKINLLVRQENKQDPKRPYFSAMIDDPDFFMVEDSSVKVSVDSISAQAFIDQKMKYGTYVCDVKISRRTSPETKAKYWVVGLSNIVFK